MEELDVMRHSAAHVMAAAVCKLYPNVKLDIGPSTDDGFYYDFDLEHRLSPEDFPAIEAEMERLIKAALPFERREVTRAEAAELMAGQPYKLDRLSDIPEDETVSLYTCGDSPTFVAARMATTADIGAVKLTSAAGLYHHGENNPMLQRLYGMADVSKRRLTRCWRVSRRPSGATTVTRQELSCSASATMSAPVWRTGIPRAHVSAWRLRTFGVASISVPATRWFSHRMSDVRGCGRRRDILASTVRVCSPA